MNHHNKPPQIILGRMENERMRVRISFAVEIDEKQWIENYGCELKDVRQDVKEYVEHGAIQQLIQVDVMEEE